MKRIFIALALLAAVQVADAQTKSPAEAKKAVEVAKEAAQNPKKAVKVATWTKLAETYVGAYNAPAGSIVTGVAKQELQFMMGNEKPVSVQEVVLGGQTYTKETYENKDLYFNANGQLAIIDVTKPVYADALEQAIAAYQEAAKVDVKQSKFKDINAGLEDIARKYVSDAFNSYQFGDLAGASVLFEKAAKAAATEPLSKIDTTAVYNAGFTAWMAQDYERAKTFLLECLEVPYYHEDGEVFSKLADVYSKLGDKAKTVEVLETGFTKFPQSQSILIGLINYYLENNENPNRLFELINMAKQNEPNNASLYYVEGNIYNELRQSEKDEAKVAEYLAKAVEAYDACEGVNPAYEFGHIGKGVLYYNLAIEIQEKANLEFDDNKYRVLVEQFEAALLNALHPFEKAYAVSADSNLKVSIAEYLKNIYYRFNTKGPEYEAGYKKYSEVVKTGVAQ